MSGEYPAVLLALLSSKTNLVDKYQYERQEQRSRRIVLKKTITHLAGSDPSKERYFISSLCVCTSGAENSSFVHKLQNILWNCENNSYCIFQLVKQEHSELETYLNGRHFSIWKR